MQEWWKIVLKSNEKKNALDLAVQLTCAVHWATNFVLPNAEK